MKGLEGKAHDLFSVNASLKSLLSISDMDRKDLQEEVDDLISAKTNLKSSLYNSEKHKKDLQASWWLERSSR